jgi:hypothetical protein
LQVDEFFLSRYRLNFNAICELAKKELASGRPLRSSGNIDLVTLTEALHTEGQLDNAGGALYLASLADGMPRVSNIKHYATIIREKAVLRNVVHAGESPTRAALEPHAKAEDVVKLAHSLSVSLRAWSSDGSLGVLASEIPPERVEWLWPGRIPLGKITVLDGDPGLGKSALTFDIAARITTGRAMPDGCAGIDGGVLVLNGEDGSADTMVPRLSAMSANLKRVRILKTLSGSEGERQPEIPGVNRWLANVSQIRRQQQRLFDYLLTKHPTDFAFFVQSCEDRVGHWLYPIQPHNAAITLPFILCVSTRSRTSTANSTEFSERS